MADRPLLERWRMYTPREVAAMLGVGVCTVYRWVRKGELPARKLGRLLFIYGRDLVPAGSKAE